MRFALGIGAVLLAAGSYTSNFGQVLYQHRNYFGVVRVTYLASENLRRLIHGHTLHGQQSLDPGLRHEPLSYFHRTGPIGQVFQAIACANPRSDVPSSAWEPDRWRVTPSPASTGRSMKSTRPSPGSRATADTSPSFRKVVPLPPRLSWGMPGFGSGTRRITGTN